MQADRRRLAHDNCGAWSVFACAGIMSCIPVQAPVGFDGGADTSLGVNGDGTAANGGANSTSGAIASFDGGISASSGNGVDGARNEMAGESSMPKAGGMSGSSNGPQADGSAEPSNGSSNNPASPVCGDGKLDPGEICDPAETCPTLESCQTSDPCLLPKLLGAADTCDASCSQEMITACAPDDLCCPQGCNNSTDSDCSVSCGDGVVTGAETCEPTAPTMPCPESCDDGDPCTKDMRTGSPEQCNVICTNMPITRPANGDQCCPQGANAGNDDDCETRCGDGAVTGDETCDPMSSTPCPTESSCRSNGCEGAKLSGTAKNCTARCEHAPITQPRSGDDCCPEGANIGNDSDCPVKCGDGVVSPGETCDPRSSRACPSRLTCVKDGCNDARLEGSASDCTAECVRETITRPRGGDDCCPGNANIGNDSDCDPKCGDGIVSSGETCDSGSGSSIPCRTQAECVAGNCEMASFTGSASSCTSECVITTIPNNDCGRCEPAPGRRGDPCTLTGGDPGCTGTWDCNSSTGEMYCFAVCSPPMGDF